MSKVKMNKDWTFSVCFVLSFWTVGGQQTIERGNYGNNMISLLPSVFEEYYQQSQQKGKMQFSQLMKFPANNYQIRDSYQFTKPQHFITNDSNNDNNDYHIENQQPYGQVEERHYATVTPFQGTRAIATRFHRVPPTPTQTITNIMAPSFLMSSNTQDSTTSREQLWSGRPIIVADYSLEENNIMNSHFSASHQQTTQKLKNPQMYENDERSFGNSSPNYLNSNRQNDGSSLNQKEHYPNSDQRQENHNQFPINDLLSTFSFPNGSPNYVPSLPNYYQTNFSGEKYLPINGDAFPTQDTSNSQDRFGLVYFHSKDNPTLNSSKVNYMKLFADYVKKYPRRFRPDFNVLRS